MVPQSKAGKIFGLKEHLQRNLEIDIYPNPMSNRSMSKDVVTDNRKPSHALQNHHHHHSPPSPTTENSSQIATQSTSHQFKKPKAKSLKLNMYVFCS
ncbi:hypothetical protein MTR_2g087540 [Medicago truncatula]|uniref:Uncharacterized protein n=1 Tax=Medicago truncatula TaxID=3880 RepID=G7IRF5_MEDTR|nr:hypothetical protein MTR_2g087540 [Medicago truncatula]